MGIFITFEGVEGCGKSVQSRALHNRLSRLSIPSRLIAEPGSTPIGNRIALLLKWAQSEISPLTELLLFNASRSQLVAEVIRPSLKEDMVIICDRYTDSTIAYQSYGRGLALETITAINSTATGGLKPDLTILLDLPADKGFARKMGGRRDRFEQEEIAFHQKVRQGYLEIAAVEPERFLVIDADQPRARIREIIWRKVSRLLSSQNKG